MDRIAQHDLIMPPLADPVVYGIPKAHVLLDNACTLRQTLMYPLIHQELCY
jgi:hypothetical protein